MKTNFQCTLLPEPYNREFPCRRSPIDALLHIELESSVGRRLLDVDAGRRVRVCCGWNGVLGSPLGAAVTCEPVADTPATAAMAAAAAAAAAAAITTASGLLRGAGGADGAAGRHAAGDCLQPRRGVGSLLFFYSTPPRQSQLHGVPPQLLLRGPGPDAAEHSGRRWREPSVSRCVVRH